MGRDSRGLSAQGAPALRLRGAAMANPNGWQGQGQSDGRATAEGCRPRLEHRRRSQFLSYLRNLIAKLFSREADIDLSSELAQNVCPLLAPLRPWECAPCIGSRFNPMQMMMQQQQMMGMMPMGQVPAAWLGGDRLFRSIRPI